MWTDNTRNAKIKGGPIKVFNISNGYVSSQCVVVPSSVLLSLISKTKSC